jgi:hypothetical protein
MTVRATTREAAHGPVASPERTDGSTSSVEFSIGFGFVLLAGVYLILSPWVIQFTCTFSMAASNMISGIVLALIAAGCARPAGLRSLAWVIPVLGAWVIASPWAISHGRGLVPLEYPGMPELTTATWLSNVIAGAVILAAGLVPALRTRRSPTHR